MGCIGWGMIGALGLLKTHRGGGTENGPTRWDMGSSPLPGLGVRLSAGISIYFFSLFFPFPFGITEGKAPRTPSSAAGWLHRTGCIWKCP